MSKLKYSKDVVGYHGESAHSNRLIWELLSNALDTIKNVYIFKHFDEYCKQLESNNQNEKLAIYWNTSYYEKLMDYIKISVAFENYNKAILLKKGILVHKIRPNYDKNFSSKQRKGLRIKVSDFFSNGFSSVNLFDKKSDIYGVFYENFITISYSHTLNDNYQEIIKLENRLLTELKNINQKRNRLHFYTDFTGAFLVKNHIEKWNFIKGKSIEIIEREFEQARIKLKNIL